MTKTLLILCLLVGAAGAFNLRNIISSLTKGPYAVVCSVITEKPDLANTIVNKLNETLAKGDPGQQFPASIAYVKNTTNQNSFRAGGQECQNFFDGLQRAFGTDLEKNGQTAADAKDKLIKFIKNKIQAAQPFFS